MIALAPPLAGLFPHSPDPYVALMLAGFVVGILGHLTRARWLVAAGVILICLGALLFPLAGSLTTHGSPAASEEPAPEE